MQLCSLLQTTKHVELVNNSIIQLYYDNKFLLIPFFVILFVYFEFYLFLYCSETIGRVTSEPVKSRAFLPRFPTATKDGFAVDTFHNHHSRNEERKIIGSDAVFHNNVCITKCHLKPSQI
jgi:hypothetical protein